MILFKRMIITNNNNNKQLISQLIRKKFNPVCIQLDLFNSILSSCSILDDNGDCSNSSTSSSSLSTMRNSIDLYRQHLFNSASTEAAKSFLLSMRNFTASSTSTLVGGGNTNVPMKKTKRRSRAAFSHAQVIELERRFAQQKYLSSTERAELATLLSVSIFRLIESLRVRSV